MQGKDFMLCEHEHAIAKEALLIARKNNKINSLSSQAELQKAMEIFHLLVFLETARGVPRRARILPHEPLDAIVNFGTWFNTNAFWRGRVGFEVVTCFGAEKDNSGKQISPGGHPDIDNAVRCILENKIRQESYIKLPETKFFHAQFINRIADKQNKKYDLKDLDKRVLLIVTGEPSDASCPVTGSWFEKSFKLEDLGINNNFNRICVLNYFSSGKDNGPTAVLDLAEEQKFYDSLLNK